MAWEHYRTRRWQACPLPLSTVTVCSRVGLVGVLYPANRNSKYKRELVLVFCLQKHQEAY